MKKSTLFPWFIPAILTVFISIPATISAKAQAYATGTNVIGADAGFGNRLLYKAPGHDLPLFGLQYERGLWKAGPGVISLGAFMGFKDEDNPAASSDAKTVYPGTVTFTTIGLRGAYHFTGWQIRNLDCYAGMMLSYDRSADRDYPNNYPSFSSAGIGNTEFMGARYFFLQHFGAFSELSIGPYQYIDLGVAAKF